MIQRKCLTSILSACMAFAMLLMGVVPVWAQQTGTISGRVVAQATQRVLPGARVQVVGTTRVGSTGEDGTFEIRDVPVGTYAVRASIIGYSSQETSVTLATGQTVNLDFTMNRAAISLDEIVVTGTPGAQEQRVVGNSIGRVQVGQELEQAPINNVTELLTARTPGLTLMANSGQAGASSNIRIRGAGSLNGGYQPVFYVDGIRIESGNVEAESTYQGGSALDFLNPDDIESIEVIKGPAAATLYGADAANGVIQIITKKGQRGAQSTQWTTSLEFGQNEWTKAVGSNTTYWRCMPQHQTNTTGNFPGCSDTDTVEFWGRDANGDPELQVGIPAEDITDIGDGTFLIQDDPLFRHPAALREGNTMDFNLSARGGTGDMGYFLSFNENREDGVYFNNFARRTGGRANFDVNVSEKLDISSQFSYTRTHLQQPLSNNASNSVLRNGMRGRARGPASPWEAGYRGFNPWLSNEFDNQNRLERMTIGLTGNWAPVEWFRNKLTLGLDRQNYRDTGFNRIDTTGRAPWGTINATGAISHEVRQIHRWTVDYAGSLDFDVSDNLNSVFSAGMQLNARTNRGYFANGQGLVANNLNLVSSAATTTGGEARSEQTSLGFFVQEQLGWRDNVFVTGAVRVDDNSAFGSDFSLVVYPKASLSWIISDESFYNIGFTDQLKLRFAWGRAGNAPAPFSADRTFGVTQGIVTDAVVNALEVDEFGNPNLKAETGQEWETGFDASLFAGRAGLEFTYYNQQTKDALIEVPDPGSTGFTGNHLVNIGEISNTGLEVLLTASPVLSRNFQWDAGIALSTNNNKLVSFNGAREEQIYGSFAAVQRDREGFPLGGFWAVDVERDASGEPVLTISGTDTSVTVLSNCRWAPSDPTWDQAAECDDIYVGPSRPTREASLTNTFTLFGNLRIFTQFDYRGGHYQWCAICSINSRIDLNTWDVNTGGTPLNPEVSAAEVIALKSLQTLSHITPADFIKFRELSLTFTFPQSWVRFLPGAQRWSATVSGRNLAIWTKYEGRGDPEVQFNPNSGFTLLDYASTPMTRRLSGSLRVSF